MYRYKNHNTGHIVERAECSSRLEHLPNWECIHAPQPAPSSEQTPAASAPLDTNPPGGGGEGEGGSGPDDGVKRPARSANKATWQAYARAVAQEAEELDAIDDMTREQLLEAYGGSED